MANVKIEDSWKKQLVNEFDKDYMKSLSNYLKNEKKFVDEHLSRWIPDFCEKVIKEAKLPFYREMAKLTKTFIEFEAEEIKRLGDNSA